MVIYRQDWWGWKCWQAPFSGRWCNPSWQTRAFEVGLPRPSSGGRYILKVPHFYQHVQTMKNYDLGNRISISRYLLTELPCCGRGGIEHNEVGFCHIQAHWASWWAEEYSDRPSIDQLRTMNYSQSGMPTLLCSVQPPSPCAREL